MYLEVIDGVDNAKIGLLVIIKSQVKTSPNSLD